jgi:hypothetical protein
MVFMDSQLTMRAAAERHGSKAIEIRVRVFMSPILPRWRGGEGRQFGKKMEKK